MAETPKPSPSPTPIPLSVWLTPNGAHCASCGQPTTFAFPRRAMETDPSKWLGPEVACRNPSCAHFGQSGFLPAIPTLPKGA